MDLLRAAAAKLRADRFNGAGSCGAGTPSVDLLHMLREQDHAERFRAALTHVPPYRFAGRSGDGAVINCWSEDQRAELCDRLTARGFSWSPIDGEPTSVQIALSLYEDDPT
jgi:hypothetical protein